MKFSELVTQSGHELDHVLKFTVEEGVDRVKEIKKRPSIVVFCENLTKAEGLVAVSEQAEAIQYLPDSIIDDEIKTAALNNDSDSFEYMHSNSDAIIDLAISLDGDNLKYLSTAEKTKQRCVDAVNKTPHAIKYCNPAVFDPE